MRRHHSWATVLALGLYLLVFTATAPTRAQESSDEARRLAVELLEVTGANDIGSQVLQQLFAQFRQADTSVPKEVWDELLAEMDPDEMVELVIPIYIEHLSVEDMQAALDFYRTPAGRRLIEKMPVILQESMAAGQEWGLQAAKKVFARLEGAAGEADSPGAMGDVGDKAAQRRTVSDMRNVGTAMLSWLTDQVVEAKPWSADRSTTPGAWTLTNPAAEKQRAVDYTYHAISHETVVEILVPTYIDEVPELDGWGHPLEFAINDNLLASAVMSIRSPGQDGVFDAETYEPAAFKPGDYDHDIVWADGYFVAWPGASED